MKGVVHTIRCLSMALAAGVILLFGFWFSWYFVHADHHAFGALSAALSGWASLRIVQASRL
jgi:hypothetical protein